VRLIIPVLAVEVCEGGSIDQFIFNFGVRGAEWSASCLGCFATGKN